MDRPVVRDGMLLVARVIIGAVFIARGWHTLFSLGPGRVTEQLAALHVPQPALAAWASGIGNMFGGILLVVGLLSTIVAGLLIAVVAAGLWYVHAPAGLFAETGGIEYPIVMIVALAIIVVFGPGRASVDGVVG